MGLTGATADDMDADLIRRVCEIDVAAKGLLATFEHVIVEVVSSPSKFLCPLLQTSAILALSKYMMIRCGTERVNVYTNNDKYYYT